MSGYRCDDFRHDCAEDGCYMDVHAPDWEWMRGCFLRPAVMPTDIDGMVELDGHLLFIEHKAAGVFLKEAQRRAFKRLSANAQVTVLIMRDHPDGYDCLIFRDGGFSSRAVLTRDGVRAWLQKWSCGTQASPREAPQEAS